MKSTNGSSKKQNIDQLDEDASRQGYYTYHVQQLSPTLATKRICRANAVNYNFTGKRVLNLGCGDGIYTLEMTGLGAAWVHGIDASTAAISVAQQRSASSSCKAQSKFEVADIYNLKAILKGLEFDCIMLWGVLHHLPNPATALAGINGIASAIIILEPNGMNPVLKVLEKVSSYHIAHGDRPYSPNQLKNWLKAAGFQPKSSSLINLVPMFCPTWLARILRFIEPVVERLPGLRTIACGQVLTIGQSKR
jgi:SAM-dependent methyltransferase